ncbi:hypothetical protein AVEN_269093-1 [Araneus ventricosus]|uniref:Uncharacterized protein n=1 Tax=Araneus ventricosus TaxID=182803 RepID=A0A4Y2UDQ8_ARAVE|nr:hypothetical protein AVEN_269093-1 [Araneus ventricosus]
MAARLTLEVKARRRDFKLFAEDTYLNLFLRSFTTRAVVGLRTRPMSDKSRSSDPDRWQRDQDLDPAGLAR